MISVYDTKMLGLRVSIKTICPGEEPISGVLAGIDATYFFVWNDDETYTTTGRHIIPKASVAYMYIIGKTSSEKQKQGREAMRSVFEYDEEGEVGDHNGGG